MKLALALGAAVVATTVLAYAHTDGIRHVVVERGDHRSADTNGDGWLSREEAAAHADRQFEKLDRDNNGRLDDADREALRQEIEVEVSRSLENVQVDLDRIHEVEARIAHLGDENCTRETATADGQRRTTIVCRTEAGEESEVGRRADRRARVLRHGPGHAGPIAPVPPVPAVHHLPMVTVWDGGEESDLNGDGWLSREEFRAQQLRYFDARDANGDGRVRHLRPQPPAAPEAPQPPDSP